MSRLALVCVSSLSLAAIFLFYFAVLDVQDNLSPQGCRMSYMWPSYVLQDNFNSSWTSLANRYSLWLYRESGHESPKMHTGIPAIFIPGNAGSSRQVRSIASSAARQYFSSAYVPNAELQAKGLKPLDVFAVEFNEDLSAFHGPTLESQTEYTAQAIKFILSLYPSNTSIIVLGHSMGGIVATTLSTDRISAIITMSTPHTLPPARFDARVEEIYDRNLVTLKNSPTPIISLCGGAKDMMIPSESCFLPPTSANPPPLRRTVFTTALEGAWTGVGHQEMVWCHQVRWRVARAALELGAAKNVTEKAAVVDQWLTDGHILRPLQNRSLVLMDSGMYEGLPGSMNLVLRKPTEPRMYLMTPKVTTSGKVKFVLYVSQGSIAPVSPRNPMLEVGVFLCKPTPASNDTNTNRTINCHTLQPTTHRLIPDPPYGKLFPAPSEGADESEGVVLFEVDMPDALSEDEGPWVGVQVERASGTGWVVGGFSYSHSDDYVSHIPTWLLLFKHYWVEIPNRHGLRTTMTFPNLISDALIVYRLDLYTETSKCIDPLLSPVLLHTSHESETHYFPLTRFNQRRILLHTHASAPYSHAAPQNGVSFIIHSSGISGCSTDLPGYDLNIDWRATLGRWASRYYTAVVVWAIGVVSYLVFESWGVLDRTSILPPVGKVLSSFCHRSLPRALLLSMAVSIVPSPEWYFLGNKGSLFFSIISPLVLFISTGLILISWCMLVILMWVFGTLAKALTRSHTLASEGKVTNSVRRSTLISMGFVFLAVFLIIPWQVAYLACWFIHLLNCSTAFRKSRQSHTPPPTPMVVQNSHQNATNNYNHNMHLLLLMTWLLPLAAPVLVVWVRTLATAGYTTPFDGDHFVLNAAPFLLLVDFASWTSGPIFIRQRFENWLSVRSCFALLSIAAFIIGPRKPFIIFDLAKVSVGIAVAIRVGPRYWGKPPWSV